ncbi:MAG: hypothetical protein LBD48_00170 [Treponema sp.]|jgi:hypothetical protein|nr:hypothetical protein [Treponema sp.]
MKRKALTILVLAVFTGSFMGCFSTGETQSSASPAASQAQTAPQQKGETQLEKFQRMFRADSEKLVVGSDNRTTIESIEAAFQPQAISSIGEITDAVLSEPGRPYYFKLRALYKGYDKKAERTLLQDLGNVKQSSTLENALGAVFGVDSNVYQIPLLGGDAIVATLPTEANSIATFYLVALRIDDTSKESAVFIRFVRNIEKPVFDTSKFIVASGTHYITVNDAHVPTQQDAMMAMMGLGAMNTSSSVFDPVVYPLADLMDARVAMDKKDIRNDYTFPTVKVKYVSEVIFKGQSNTTITVSTSDNVLTERMNFAGRAAAVQNGAKIRVYYTIAKDPLEKWEVQAIERL